MSPFLTGFVYIYVYKLIYLGFQVLIPSFGVSRSLKLDSLYIYVYALIYLRLQVLLPFLQGYLGL